MKKSYLLALTALLSVFLILTGCSDSSNTKATKSGKLNVYTTVYPLQYLTEQIGGKYVDVKSIYPPGSDAHSFEPTQKDMMK
ncbi:metal ABC transporter substrate-binding protein, partial [Listeria innocua]